MAYKNISRVRARVNQRIHKEHSFVNKESNSVLGENTALMKKDKGLIAETAKIQSPNKEEASGFKPEKLAVSRSSARGTFFNGVLIGEVILVIIVIILINSIRCTE